MSSPFSPSYGTKQILQTLSVIPGTDQISRQCLHKLQTICGQRTTLPSSYKVSGGLSRVGDSAVAYGGFADVWQGTHKGQIVCIKMLRISLNDGSILEQVRIRHRRVIGVSAKQLWTP